MKEKLSVLLVLAMLVSAVGQTIAQDSLSATDIIAQAAVLGYEPEISASELESILTAFDNIDFSDSDEISGASDLVSGLSSDGVRRYSCSRVGGWFERSLRVNYWADMEIRNGRFAEKESVGWNLDNWAILGTTVTNAQVNAYIGLNGWLLTIRFDGTLQLWLGPIPVREKSINISCRRSP